MNTSPIILSFDSSAQHCTAAVVQGEEVLAYKFEEMTKGQAERLMDLLLETLDCAGTSLEQVGVIGVGIGPGNFTGIRIAVSAARGLALGLACPAVGVTGFDALQFGQTRACVCAIEARRGQVYVQSFDRNAKANEPQLLEKQEIPADAVPLVGAGGTAPKFRQAVAIARLAAQRYKTVRERPAPFYIRPADAAPAKEAAPLILP